MQSPRRILVVDDEAPNRRLLSRILRQEGHATVEAEDAASALRMLGEGTFDLVYLDVMMPVRDGVDLLRELREREETRSLPIVLVTALHSMEDKVRGLAAGADDFLTKPINQAELRARTQTLLRVKALRDAEAEARREVEQKNAELLRLQAAKQSLTQMLVHDLKNPLTGIQGHIDLLLLRFRTALDPRGVASLRTIQRSSQELLRMVTALLDVHLMEEDAMKVNRRRVEPRELIDEVGHEFAAEAEWKEKALRLEIAGDLGPVQADPDLVRRVLGNLVANALKHAPEAGRITLRAARAGEMIRFEVCDNGEGVAPMERERIFEKFARVDRDGKGHRTDRGLGLTFCRMAVEAMGGRIHVEDEPGGGSRFCFTLPRAAGEEAAVRAAGLAGAPPS